jgi:hypothetical protein
VVYAKPTAHHVRQVVAYLGRYVHRVAIDNRRLKVVDAEGVTFRYRESATGKLRRMRLSGFELLRRFLQHVVPRGLHKVRYYGLLSPSWRPRYTALQRALAAPAPAAGASVVLEGFGARTLQRPSKRKGGRALAASTAGCTRWSCGDRGLGGRRDQTDRAGPEVRSGAVAWRLSGCRAFGLRAPTLSEHIRPFGARHASIRQQPQARHGHLPRSWCSVRWSVRLR